MGHTGRSGAAALDRGVGRGSGWALLATSLGFGVVQLDVSVVNVAIKPIGAALGDSVTGLQWVVNAYTIAFAALILTAGALGDRIGAKRVFVAGFVLFTAASALCALAPTLAVLIAARAVQGVGAAVLVPCSLTLLNHAYSTNRDRARAVGLWAAGASVGFSAGPMFGGLLTAWLGWRSIFFINAPVGLLGIALTIRYARETTRSTDRGIDVPGQVLAVVALLAFATATVEGGRLGFGNPFVLGGFAIAVLASVSFVIVESRLAQPMLPPHLFASRTFALTSVIGLGINIAFYGLIFVLSLYFQTTLKYSVLVTGLAFGPTTGVVLFANLLSGRLAHRWGARRVIMAGSLLSAAGLIALLPITTATPYAGMVGQLVALGFGLGLIVPAMTTASLGSVPRDRSGVAAGTLNTARQTGSMLGVALYGSLAATGIAAGLHLSLAVSLGLVLLMVAVAAGVSG